MKFKINLFLLFIWPIYAEIVNVHISSWDELISYKPTNKEDEYVFILDKILSATNPSNFLSQYKKVTIKSEDSKKRIYCTGTDLSSLFNFESQSEELDLTLQTLLISSCKYPQVVVSGPNVNVNLINVEFSQNQDSAIQATNVKSVTIDNCKFK